MIALTLAVVLTAADAGLPDGGEYVVLDVNHGALWLNLPDGGVSDQPTAVRGGAYLDDDALMHNAKGLAFGRGALAVPPEVDIKTVLSISLVMFSVGILLGVIGCSVLGVKFPWSK